MRWPAVRRAATAAATLVVVGILAPPAHADPADPEQLRARVVDLRTQLETLEVDVETAVERYNEAADQLDTAVSEELAARREWDDGVSAAADARQEAARRVRALYRAGPTELTVSSAAFSGRVPLDELTGSWHAARSLVDDDARALRHARGLTDRSLRESQDLEDARRERVVAELAATAERDRLEAALLSHEALLAGAEAELVAAVERERQEAEALAVAWAAGTSTPVADAAALQVVAQAAETAPSAQAAAAVTAATTRLGMPYTWGATGPGTFDCSGLIQWAYAGAGVSVPRTSRQQQAGLTPVPLDRMLPGDLVFYASGPDARSIHHVGLYVGSGLMIHAPRTGDVVRLAAIDRRPAFGAVRPVPVDI